MGGRSTRGLWLALAGVIAFLAVGIWVGESNEEPAAGGATVEVAGNGSEPSDDDTATSGSGQRGRIADGADLVEITAADYSFDMASEIAGGLVRLSLVNEGEEPHFAALAQPREGVTNEAVRAALSSAGAGDGAGPPPFVEYAGLGTVDPGGESRMTLNLPAGRYVVYCALPAPDGVPHLAKGMMTDLVVTPGTTRGLPETDVILTTADFAIGGPREFTPGTNRVMLDNRGKQLHEINLVEIPDGKTIDDAIAWVAAPAGPPPLRFLGGPAIRNGLAATTTFDLEAGVDYAFVCVIPDSLGDFTPHIAKGMYTSVFQIEP